MNYFDKRAKKYLNNSRGLFWSQFRQKELRDIKQAIAPFKGMSMLDLGSGAGFYSLYFKKEFDADVLAVDSSLAMISELQTNGIDNVHSNIERFETDKKFDRILAAGVLEFVDSPSLVFKNVTRMLKEGGKFIALVPRRNVGGWLYQVHHQLHGCSLDIIALEEFSTIGSQNNLKIDFCKNSTIMSLVVGFSKIS